MRSLECDKYSVNTSPFIHTHFCLFSPATIVSFTPHFFLLVTVLFVRLLVFALGDGIHGGAFGFYFKIRRKSCVGGLRQGGDKQHATCMLCKPCCCGVPLPPSLTSYRIILENHHVFTPVRPRRSVLRFLQPETSSPLLCPTSLPMPDLLIASQFFEAT